MEKQTKPENIYIRRNRALTAIAALAFFALGAGIAIVFWLAIIKTPPAEDIYTLLVISVSFAVAVTLYMAVLNIRNLFFPFLLTADEKGVYNFSGFFHYGFIAWDIIESFSKDAAILDFLENESPHVKIYIKDFKNYKKSINFYRKWLLFWNGGNVKIFTLTSQIKKMELLTLLEASLSYYGSADKETVENGK